MEDLISDIRLGLALGLLASSSSSSMYSITSSSSPSPDENNYHVGTLIIGNDDCVLKERDEHLKMHGCERGRLLSPE